MSPTFQALGIDRLDVEQRLALVQEIWDSIAQETASIPLAEEQRNEIDRRWAAHEANPAAAIPWESVEAEALARLRK